MGVKTWDNEGTMNLKANGDWVLLDDHEAEIAKLREALEKERTRSSKRRKAVKAANKGAYINSLIVRLQEEKCIKLGREINELREDNQRLRYLLRRAVGDLEECAKHTNYQSTIIHAINKQLKEQT